MNSSHKYDAVIVGSGPNGLAAAIILAQAGLSVVIFEAKDTVGGGMRTAELTEPGFLHDICSAIYPLAVASPFYQEVPLSQYGLNWIQPTFALAHPFEDEPPLILEESIENTSKRLKPDTKNYRKIIRPLARNWSRLLPELLGPLRFIRNPVRMLGFALYGIQSAIGFSLRHFSGPRARALFSGLAAHSILPLDRHLTAAIGLVLGVTAHTVGWPFPEGGSQRIANAMASYLKSLGVEIVLQHHVRSIKEVPKAKVFLFDTTPRQLINIVSEELPTNFVRKLEKFRYGSGIFKIDWALSEPIPFKYPECRKAATVHIGGNWDEIALAEEQVGQGRHPDQPFVILAQQSLFDSKRAPAGKQTAWGYCHVPSYSTVDMTGAIEDRIERFAPGFKDIILARHVMNCRDYENYNANYIGGDINAGVQDWRQVFARPTLRLNPYSTPNPSIFICSSSTPPGGGVHGMCGYHAARTVLKRVFQKRKDEGDASSFKSNHFRGILHPDQ